MEKKLEKLIREIYQKEYPKQEFIPGITPVPVSGKIFDEKEILLMTEAVLDGWWTEGRFNKEFEEKIANFIGTKYCSTVNSGSSANLVAFMSLTSRLLGEKRINRGDEVITLAAGFPTTINPIIQAGCVPVFVDVEMKTLSIDPSQLEWALSKKTRAIFIAHTLGNPFDIEKIQKFCKKHDLWLIEDNCDALGSEYNKKKTGSFGDISTLSFYPAHHITTAEGGAVLTNNPLLHKAIRSIRDWGRDCWCPTGHDDTCKKRFSWKLGELPHGYDHKYIYSHIGYNLKMTEIQAACGIAQLKKLPGFIQKRRANYKLLKNKLSRFDKFFDIVEPTKNSNPSWFGLLLTLNKNCNFERESFLKFLNKNKIGTRLLFAGNIIKQPYFVDYKIKHRKVGPLKNTDRIMSDTFWIGTYPGLTIEMIDWIEKSFENFFKINQK